MKGRYVNIRMKGPSKILTLCEVEVYAEGTKCSFYRYTNIGNVYGCIYRLELRYKKRVACEYRVLYNHMNFVCIFIGC